jgi:hypothetical protein
MKSEIDHQIKIIKEAADEIQKNHDGMDVLINMRYEKPVGSSVIHTQTLSKICLQIYKGIPWRQAIDDVLNEVYKGIGKGTINAYRNDYRLFFRTMIDTINQEEIE